MCTNFNPRSREGSDTNVWFHVTAPDISIHAPARGATFFTISTSFYMRYFNPRSREGSDLYIFFNYYTIKYFNPHSREGSDQKTI